MNNNSNSIGVGIFSGSGDENEMNYCKVLAPMLSERGFKLKAIWSRNKDEAQKLANELKIPYFTDKIDDVLLRKDVIFSFVLCQPYFHSHIVVKSLGIGKHVFIISLGLSNDDALKMVNAANYYPSLITLVNHPLRFLPTFTIMRKIIKENQIGKVLLIDVKIDVSSLIQDKFNWLSDCHMGGGVLSLYGNHVIDAVHFLTEKKASRVHGIIKTFSHNGGALRRITANDFCNFQMELAGGILVTANLQSNNYCSEFKHYVSVICEEGNLVANGMDLTLRKKDGTEEKLYTDIKQCTIETNIPQIYVRGMKNMVVCVNEAFTPSDSSWNKDAVSSSASFDDACYVQKIIEALRQSSDMRSWIKIE